MDDQKDQNVDNYKSEVKTDWKNPPSVLDLKSNFQEAKSSADTMKLRISNWLSQFHITDDVKIKKTKGKSAIQPKYIRKMAEWRYAALSEPFLSRDDLFTVKPITYEDVQAARQNQLVLNNQFNTKIDRVKFIDSMVRAMVSEGTAIVRVGWDYSSIEVKRNKEVYDWVEARTPDRAATWDEQYQMYTADPISYINHSPYEWKEAMKRSIESNTMIVPVFISYEKVTEEKTLCNKPTVEVCDYRNVTVDPSCNGNLDKARFLVYSYETTLDELRKAGKYSNLDTIENGNMPSPSEAEDHESDSLIGEDVTDRTRKIITAYEYWGDWDINDEGVTTPIVATYVGNTMIRLQENPFPDQKIPFVFIPYLPITRSLYGEPDGELLKDNQTVIGAMMRGVIDTLGRSAAGQKAFIKGALDPINRKRLANGEDFEINPTNYAAQPMLDMQFPELPQSASAMITYMATDGEALVGVKPFSMTNGMDSLGESATQVRGALDAASKREVAILRRAAHGVTSIGKKIMAMNAVFLDEAEVVRISNEQFVKITAEDLVGGFDLHLDITTAEEDQMKAQELAFMLQTIGPNADWSINKIVLANIARLRKMPDLAKKIEEYEPQPDPIEAERAKLEVMLLKAKLQEAQANARLKLAQERKALADAGKSTSTSLKEDSVTRLNDLELVEQESGVHHEREKELMQAQAQGNMNLEIVKQAVSNSNKKSN